MRQRFEYLQVLVPSAQYPIRQRTPTHLKIAAGFPSFKPMDRPPARSGITDLWLSRANDDKRCGNGCRGILSCGFKKSACPDHRFRACFNRRTPRFIMTEAILFQPLLSTIAVLTAFLLMIWPGYALLHVLGHGRHRWSGALFAGPGLTLALWIIALSGAAWASIPLRHIFGPVWIATLLLAALGIFLRISVNRQIVADENESGQCRRLVGLIAVVVPLLIMPATLRYGLGDFVNSTYPDPWSYVMVADYLSAVTRGTEGGLASLHQYASHLMNTRNASSAILAQLAAGFGDIKADQVMTLFCLLVLFANVGALIAFARTIFGRAGLAACLALLAGLGWPANIVFAGNFDQLLLLPLLPLIAALALRAAGSKLWSASILIGILGAAALFAYVELAFLGILVAMSFVIPPDASLRMAIGRAILVCCIAALVIAVLTWPGFDALLHMLTSQFALASGAVRPGEGYFAGLTSPLRLPGAVSALGGEFPRTPWSGVPWIVGAALCAVTLAGAWRERRRWSVVLAFAVVALAFVHFAYRQHYSYGAYKIISVNIWFLGFLTVAGGIWLAEWSRPRLPRRIPVTAVVAAVLFAVTLDRSIVQANAVHYRNNAVEQSKYREALTIAAIVKDAPTLLSVRDDVANEWAVFYLSNPPLLIAPYRRYMAQAHVIPFMERAKAVDPAGIRYIVTDHSDAVRAPLTGARRVWDGQAYSLWSIDDPNWAIIADVRNPNGIEPGGLWPGGPKTEFLVVTARGGPAVLTATARPGPRAAPGTSQFHLLLEDAAGNHQTTLQSGINRLLIDLTAGRGVVAITVQEPVGGPVPSNGDARPMILPLTDYRIEREGKNQR
jgi:hypothetical protein